MSAQTACSRDDPVPKSGPATRTVAPSYCGWLATNSGSLRHAAKRPSSKPVRVTRLRYTAGMIWSVSTLLRRRGRAVPVWVVKLSMINSSLQVGRRAQRAVHRGRRGDQWRHQVGPAALALATFEGPVGGRGGALAGGELVGVHA